MICLRKRKKKSNISIYLDWFNTPSLFNTAFCYMFGSRGEREEKENYLVFSLSSLLREDIWKGKISFLFINYYKISFFILELSKYHINTPSSHIRHKLTKIDRGTKIKHFATFRNEPTIAPLYYLSEMPIMMGRKENIVVTTYHIPI